MERPGSAYPDAPPEDNLSCSNGHHGISFFLVGYQGNQTVVDFPDAGLQLGVFHADQAKGSCGSIPVLSDTFIKTTYQQQEP